MSNEILVCNSFNIDIGINKYQSDGFIINSGDIIHLFSTSEFRAQEFLYLIAGLHLSRELTIPSSGKSLKRKSLHSKNLDFLIFNNRPLYEIDLFERAKLISLIYENPDTAIIGRTVIEEYMLSNKLSNYKLHSSDLIRYGLYEKIYRSTNVLSGGEKHRLICARALEIRPLLLIGDFSSSNLDDDFLCNFLSWIEEFSSEGNAVLLTGLNPEDLKVFPKYKALVSKDEKIQFGKADDSFHPSLNKEAEQLKSLLNYREIQEIVILNVENAHIKDITKPISFEIKQNEILIITGANGCGKTTLGRILTQQIKTFEGGINFTEPDITPLLSIQHPERSFIYWEVKSELSNIELLEICGIDESEHELHPRSLSRSKQKLLSVAVTLLKSKKMAIIDEPTAGMDFKAKKCFIKLINYFNDKTILIFTHDRALINLSRTISY